MLNTESINENCSDVFPNLSDLLGQFHQKIKKLNKFLKFIEGFNKNEIRPKPAFLINFKNDEANTILRANTLESNSFRANSLVVETLSPFKKKKDSTKNYNEEFHDSLNSKEKHIKHMKSKKNLNRSSRFSTESHGLSPEKRPLNSLSKNKPLLENYADKKKSFYSVISNFYLTRKFINLLKNFTSKRTPKYLNKYHFDLMNDKSFYYDEYLKTEAQRDCDLQQNIKPANFSTRIGHLFKRTYDYFDHFFAVFDINQSFTTTWNAAVVISILFFFIYLPLFACFEDKAIEEFEFFVILKFTSLAIQLLDVAKRLNTSFYKKGNLIMDRREIVKHYLRNQLWLDIASIGPILYQEFAMGVKFDESSNEYSRLMTFLFFLKFSQFQYIVKKFEEMIFIDEMFHNSLSMLKLIFRILVLSHIFACFWYMIGKSHLYEETWLTKFELSDKGVWTKYLNSYYYVCVTMNTVGYGDLTPQNPLEKLFAIIFIYIACGVFAYSLNSIGTIVNDLTKRSNELSKELNVINEFMNEKNINFDLRMRVRNYLEYIFKEEKIEKVEEQSQIIKKLSESIKEELLIEANGAVIRDIKLFSLNFSEDTLRKTVLIMKEIRFTPGDIIFNRNDYNNKDLYLIRKGAVELFLYNEFNQCTSDITVIKRLKEGELFGEKSFFTNKERLVSGRSIDFTTVYVINQEDFIAILRKNTKDFEKFCKIKDSINVYNEYGDLFVKCASCNQNTHLIDQCPLVHYLPAQEIIIQRYTYNPSQKRESFKRNFNRYKFQTLCKLESIEKKAFLFQANNMTKFDSDDDESEGTSIVATTLTNKSNSTISEHDDIEKDPNEDSKENEEEEKHEKILEKDETSSSFRLHEIAREKRNVHRKSGKKRNILYLKKQSSSRSNAEKSRSIEMSRRSDETFQIDSLENMEIILNNCESASSTSSSLHSMKKINFSSILMKLFDHFNKLQKKKQGFEKKNSGNQDFGNNIGSVEIIERSFEIDLIKSYEAYYVDGNIDVILDKIEETRKKKMQKKMKRAKSIYNILIPVENTQKERSRFFDTEINGVVNKKNNIMRRNFFKNSRNLEKLIMEDQFNIDKFKAYYIKKYEKENRIGCWERLRKWLKSFIRKRRTKTRIATLQKNLETKESQKRFKD